jgi:hypothetical protein
MRGGVFSKNIWEGASERRNENIIVSGPLKIFLGIFFTNFLAFHHFFFIFHLQFFIRLFDRIELATYPNKPFDLIEPNQQKF